MRSPVLTLLLCCASVANLRCAPSEGDGIADSGPDVTDSAPPVDSHAVDVSTATDGSDADAGSVPDTGSVPDMGATTDTSPDDAGDGGGLCIVQFHESLPPCTPQDQSLECFDYNDVNGAYYRCCGGVWLREPTDAGWTCPPTPDSGTD